MLLGTVNATPLPLLPAAAWPFDDSVPDGIHTFVYCGNALGYDEVSRLTTLEEHNTSTWLDNAQCLTRGKAFSRWMHKAEAL